MRTENVSTVNPKFAAVFRAPDEVILDPVLAAVARSPDPAIFDPELSRLPRTPDKFVLNPISGIQETVTAFSFGGALLPFVVVLRVCPGNDPFLFLLSFLN